MNFSLKSCVFKQIMIFQISVLILVFLKKLEFYLIILNTLIRFKNAKNEIKFSKTQNLL